MSEKTVVLSAKFARKQEELWIPSDLEKSLAKLNFHELVVFNHRNVLKSGQIDTLDHLARANPMGKFQKITREFLRRNRLGKVQDLTLKFLGNFLSLMIPHNLRHFYYQELLTQFNKRDFVFIVDSRDLVFQMNPIEVAQQLKSLGDIHFFDERSYYLKNGLDQLIKNSDPTIRWIRLYKMNSRYDTTKMNNEWIINGGCIAGYVDDLRYFNNLACEAFAKNPVRLHEILDQALVNCPIYEGDLENLGLVIHPNGDFVLNMCGIVEENITCEKGVLKRNNMTIPIVHQYDRLGFYQENAGLSFNKKQHKYQNLN